MRTTILAFSFLFTFSSIINAQYKELIKNDDITWIAEFEMELSFDSKQMKNNANIISIKKSNAAHDMNSNWLTEQIFNMMVKGEVLSYRTANLDALYSIEEIFDKTFSYDTIVSYPPGVLAEKMEVYKNELDPHSIHTCITKQIIFYNEKYGNYGTSLIAIAPLLINYDEYGNPVNKMPFGWVKMSDVFKSRIDATASNVTWAASINTSVSPLDLSQLRVVKGGHDFRKHLYGEGLQSEYKLENGSKGFNSGIYLSSNEVKSMYNGMLDTVIIFDPTTYEDKMHVVKNSVDASDLNSYRLVQEWYFIPGKQLLVNRLKAIAPLVTVKLDDDSEVYERAVFYIRY